jgi:hypothetical protein
MKRHVGLQKNEVRGARTSLYRNRKVGLQLDFSRYWGLGFMIFLAMGLHAVPARPAKVRQFKWEAKPMKPE